MKSSEDVDFFLSVKSTSFVEIQVARMRKRPAVVKSSLLRCENAHTLAHSRNALREECERLYVGLYVGLYVKERILATQE